MGELILAAPVAGLAEKNRIGAEDVLMLRREVFGDGVVTRGEAELLFALDATCSDKCAEWGEFFVEALSDFLVHQEKPEGYVSEDNAAWLVRAVSRDGMVDTMTELELLVRVLEKARAAPEKLSAYALQQVAHAVVEGKGPLAKGGTLAPGIVNKAEVELLRRILYAFSGEGNVGITRAEAEILFSINDGTVEEMNDPAWNELFVKAIANFVLCASGYATPSREEALRHEAFFDDDHADIGGFFSCMVSGGVRGLLDAYKLSGSVEDDWAARNRRSADAVVAAEAVDSDEAKWLADRIGKDRLLHDNERALLSFIKKEAHSIHPDLKPLIDKVA